jgi:predicted methyltransferase
MKRFAPLFVLLAACSAPAAAPAPALEPAAKAAEPAAAPPSKAAEPAAAPSLGADRSEEDKALDAGRKPAEMLAFFGIRPGMHVAEICAGGGYTTELLARAVGEQGVVFGENPRFILEKFAEKPWSARLQKPVMKNVRRVDRELDSPLPDDARNLDAVVSVLFYHDTVWLKANRDAMNRAIFAALRSGGVYGIVDHSARAGAGLADVQTLHRIEEKALVDEVTRAGFRLAESSEVLRNPSDTRDWSASPGAAGERRGTSDRFMLRFVKP